jgi:methylisocitrate lyase
MTTQLNPGARFRAAIDQEKPLQCVGAINAYHARLAQASGYRSLYISGGGVAAGSCGIPDLGITTMEDVLTDLRRITDVTELPVLVDIDTGWGGAFNIARTIRSMNKSGAAAVHLEDQVQQKRCGHRPNKAIVSRAEMVDRIKAAVDARLDDDFVVMARTDALAVEGMQSAIDRACACVEAGADMIFPEAMTELDQYREFVAAVKVPVLANITEFGATPLFTVDELAGAGVSIALYPPERLPCRQRRCPERIQNPAQRRYPAGSRRHHAEPGRALRLSRLPRFRTETGQVVCLRGDGMT